MMEDAITVSTLMGLTSVSVGKDLNSSLKETANTAKVRESCLYICTACAYSGAVYRKYNII